MFSVKESHKRALSTTIAEVTWEFQFSIWFSLMFHHTFTHATQNQKTYIPIK